MSYDRCDYPRAKDAGEQERETMLTLTNARLFDGKEMLPGRHNVTIDQGRILGVGDEAHAVAGTGETVDLGGLLLMPGLISSHLHPDFYKFSIGIAQFGIPLGKELPPGVLTMIAVRTCRVLLESGFTGYIGAACGHDIDAQLKMAIASDIIPGPRIRACGHHLGTTGDLNQMHHPWWLDFKSSGVDLFVDGPEALSKLVREEIRRGVETIKIFASDGHDSGNTKRNMTTREIQAVVETAHERGAKVRAHVCGKEVLLECIKLGVDIIDHGDDMDDECIDAMLKTGAAWVPSQRYTQCMLDLGFGGQDGILRRQFEHVQKTLPIADKAGVPILIGDDYSGIFREAIPDDPLDHQVGNYGRELAYYAALDGVSATDVMRWGTSNPGRFLIDAPAKLGVVEAGALADLIVVDGDPLADLTIFSKPEQHLKAVIRDGAFAIDRLPQRRDRVAA